MLYRFYLYLRKRGAPSSSVTVDQNKGPTQLEVSIHWKGRCMSLTIASYTDRGNDIFVGSNVLGRSTSFCKLHDLVYQLEDHKNKCLH